MRNIYAATGGPAVAKLDVDARAAFLVRTYAHLSGAIALFTALEILLFRSGWTERLAYALGGRWMLALGGFLVVGWLAGKVAHGARSLPAQYAALGAFVLAEAVIFSPLIFMASLRDPSVLQSAVVVTLAGFAGLTGVVFFTRKDFSFLRGILFWGFVCALLLIGASLLFDWRLGTWFSVGMIAFAGAAILYDTSNVMLHHPEDRHVGAALELFGSVALLFWYVLSLFLSSRD